MKKPITKFRTTDGQPIYALTPYWYINNNKLEEVTILKTKEGRIKVVIDGDRYDLIPWGNNYCDLYANKLSATRFLFDKIQLKIKQLNEETVKLLAILTIDQIAQNSTKN